MVILTRNQYDGGAAGGDGNLTGVTTWADADTVRQTMIGYDFRHRHIWIDGEEDANNESLYDNLNRAIRSSTHDGNSAQFASDSIPPEKTPMNYSIWISDLCEFYGNLRRRSVKRGNWFCEIGMPISQEQLRRDFCNDGLKDLISDDLLRFWTEGTGACHCHAYMDIEAEDNQDLNVILNKENDEVPGSCLSLAFRVQILSPVDVVAAWKSCMEPPDDSVRQDRIEDMNTRNRLGEWIPFFDYEKGEYIAIESKHVRKESRVAVVNVLAGPDRVRDVQVIADSFDEFLDLWTKNAYRAPRFGGFRGADGLVFSEQKTRRGHP